MMKDDNFYPTVGLSLETILRECIKPEYKGKENGVRHKFNSQNNDNIHEVFRYRRYTDTFSDFITVKIKGDNGVGIPLGESGTDCEGGVESVHSLPSSYILYHTKSEMQVCLIK